MESHDPMSKAIVLDQTGQRLSPCAAAKAWELVENGEAILVSPDPLTIQLPYAVTLPEPPPAPEAEPFRGQRLLLHICCGPCATYSVRRLREVGFDVTGYWYNPNIHPFSEHERRRESLLAYAQAVALPVVESEGYEMVEFLRRVVGKERKGKRCAICYEMRLAATAQAARAGGYDAITTTLLISPYQNQALIREIGERVAAEHGVAFYFENLRRGWSQHGRLAQEHGLYQQRYCGCLYSEWEALDADARQEGPARLADQAGP